MTQHKKGWRGESGRHALSTRGIKTKLNSAKRSAVENVGRPAELRMKKMYREAEDCKSQLNRYLAAVKNNEADDWVYMQIRRVDKKLVKWFFDFGKDAPKDLQRQVHDMYKEIENLLYRMA